MLRDLWRAPWSRKRCVLAECADCAKLAGCCLAVALTVALEAWVLSGVIEAVSCAKWDLAAFGSFILLVGLMCGIAWTGAALNYIDRIRSK